MITIENTLAYHKLIQEDPRDYKLHINPDKTSGGWVHKNAGIGAGVFIGEGAVVMNAAAVGDSTAVGRYSKIESCVVINKDCLIGSWTTVGEFSNLLPRSKVGDICNLKSVDIGEDSSVGNCCVLVDADIDAECKIGDNCTMRKGSSAGYQSIMDHNCTLEGNVRLDSYVNLPPYTALTASSILRPLPRPQPLSLADAHATLKQTKLTDEPRRNTDKRR